MRLSGPLTLGRAVDLFLADKAAEGAAAKTTSWYRMILTRLLPYLGKSKSAVVAGPAHE
jgi:hypothetical protein